MALSQAILKEEFLKLLDSTHPNFAGYPATLIDAVTNWTNAYNTYASMASDLSGEPLIAGNTALFTSSLLAGMVPMGTPATAAAAFEAAFVAYWMGMLFMVTPAVLPIPTVTCPNIGVGGFFSIKASSIVTVVAPGILQAYLLAEFAVLSSDAATKADSLATAFHDATTQAVQVTISGSDVSVPTPLPITNICGVF